MGDAPFLLDADIDSLRVNRLFAVGSNVTNAKPILNKILERNPNMRYVVWGIVLYPVLKWSMFGESISNIINFETDDTKMFVETQQMIRTAFGVGRDIELNARNAYFEKCRAFVSLMENAVTEIYYGTRQGEKMATALMVVMNLEPPEGRRVLSRYEMQSHLPKAIEWLNIRYGNEIQFVLRDILTPNKELFNFGDVSDDKCAYVYHNIKLLLKEYSRLYWARSDSSNIVSRVLHAKTPEEVIKITESDIVLYSTDVVLQFILLISGAISLVGIFPKNGEEYARVLRALVSNRKTTLENGSTGFLTEGELAISAGMNGSTFSLLKQEGMALLSILLWGYDGVEISNLAKLGKGGNVNTDVLLRICNALNCDVGDIMEFVREENFEEQERKDAFPNE